MIISDFTKEETKILTFTEITGQCYFLCEEEPIILLLDSEKSQWNRDPYVRKENGGIFISS